MSVHGVLHSQSLLCCYVQVTDTRGFMARSVVPENSSRDSGLHWHESTSLPGWRWRGETSSDEVVGHMFAYPLLYDLLADGEEAKEEVEDLVGDIVGKSREGEGVCGRERRRSRRGMLVRSVMEGGGGCSDDGGWGFEGGW